MDYNENNEIDIDEPTTIRFSGRGGREPCDILNLKLKLGC